MHTRSMTFRLTAATAVAGLMLSQGLAQMAMAQPMPQDGGPPMPGLEAANPPERAGRVAQVNGTLSFHTADANQWSPASANYPVATGDAFWTEPNATAGLEISASRLVMAGGTELDIATLDANGLQATVPQGEVYLNLRDPGPNETWSVLTPRGVVTFSGPGRYAVIAGDTQNPTVVTVLAGAAQLTGPGLGMPVAAGQSAVISGTDTLQANLAAAQPDAFVAAAQQAERPLAPPTAAVAAPAAVAQMPGGSDLSLYGTWSEAPQYGQVWYPQVDPGWVPYRTGHWAWIPPWGWTWVDDEPWGFAPFHYGRWVEIGDRWAWTPGLAVEVGPPVYAPALVAFFGIGAGIGIGAALAAGTLGWCPLGPREVYHPWYRTSTAYMRAVNLRDVGHVAIFNRNVTIENFANRHAATVVPAGAMTGSRPLRQIARGADPRTLTSARPVFGTPIQPTAATAGITPGLAQRMHLAPAPGGAAVAHVAPGPAIRGFAPGQGPGGRPPLLSPGHANGTTLPAVARPGGPGTPGAMPALRVPGAREGGPPPIQHAMPGMGTPRAEFARPSAAQPQPTQPTRPGGVPFRAEPGGSRPQPQLVHPAPAAQARPVPELHPGPQFQAPQPQSRPAPEVHPVQQFHAPPPQPRPAPEVHPVQQFHAPPPQPRPAPEVHPAQQFHPAQPQPQPHPAPQFHAPPPQPHPAPAPSRPSSDQRRPNEH